MSDEHEQEVTAALTFKVPKKIGWSVQHEDMSWRRKELSGLVDCLARESGGPMTLSLSMIFELTGNDGTLRSTYDPPQF